MKRQGRRAVMLNQLGNPGGLLGDEILERQLPSLNPVERLFPDGSGRRIRDGGRH
jgi:hypothetical protein